MLIFVMVAAEPDESSKQESHERDVAVDDDLGGDEARAASRRAA